MRSVPRNRSGEVLLKQRQGSLGMNAVEDSRNLAATRDSCRRSLVLTFVDRGCRVVSAMNPHGRNLGFLDRNRYFLEIAPQLSSRG
jgi:hypothetical protein